MAGSSRSSWEVRRGRRGHRVSVPTMGRSFVVERFVVALVLLCIGSAAPGEAPPSSASVPRHPGDDSDRYYMH